MANHPNRKRATTSVAAKPRPRTILPAHDHDADWAALLKALPVAFAPARSQPVFTTNVENLWNKFIAGVGREKDVHNCHACKRFVNRFGGLVRVTDDGHTVSAFWDENIVPAFYRSTIAAMAKAVERAKITGPFLSKDAVWGTPTTGDWTHFAVPSPNVYKRGVLSAGQAMAAKREDHHTVARALDEFTPPMLAEAERLLLAEHLPRSEHFLGPVQWLAELHARRAEAKDARLRDNLLWRAVAVAPEGFCHPKSSVVGTLLQDIAAGLPFADVRAKFVAMVHPLQYQRPQAAPKAQNIAQAEKVVAELGLAKSLERRFARLDDIELAWGPAARQAQKAAGSVFGHLEPKGTAAPRVLDAPAATMTWEKFARMVLPSAEAIECYVSGTMNFIALTTAAHADAPPVLKWDRDDARNSVAWYVYHGGSPCSQWRLSGGWTKVSGICALPPMWGEKPQPHLGEGFVLILDGCLDTREGQGNALFPECLRPELHGIRQTIEAFSRRAEMLGREDGSACGLDIRKGAANLNYRLRVTSCGTVTDYLIDRWD